MFLPLLAGVHVLEVVTQAVQIILETENFASLGPTLRAFLPLVS